MKTDVDPVLRIAIACGDPQHAKFSWLALAWGQRNASNRDLGLIELGRKGDRPQLPQSLLGPAGREALQGAGVEDVVAGPVDEARRLALEVLGLLEKDFCDMTPEGLEARSKWFLRRRGRKRRERKGVSGSKTALDAAYLERAKAYWAYTSGCNAAALAAHLKIRREYLYRETPYPKLSAWWKRQGIEKRLARTARLPPSRRAGR
ncbi:MAG: hypothetical protein HY721_16980 [Planctomycetes bacterium]|nr:hypothetical protein [Planctomycetota bacterium]